MASAGSASQPCSKCKTAESQYMLRKHPSCGPCYAEFVEGKMTRRLGHQHRAARDAHVSHQFQPRYYLAGLSFGPSSSAMVHVLEVAAKFYLARQSTAFKPCAVHVDVDLDGPDEGESPAARRIAQFKERFPHVDFQCVHLTRVLEARTLDWAALPLATEGFPKKRLRDMFAALPNMTSRADVLRLLVRHVLLNLAIERSSSALLLGHSTTALAAATLAEVANGRGFSVPHQMNDGLHKIRLHRSSSGGDAGPAEVQFDVLVYYPLREVSSSEITVYVRLATLLDGLVVKDPLSESVVSYRDLSISDVMTRYFSGVEDSYVGIVANVVRTAEKLERVDHQESCGLCGMSLDELGDARWAGEMGEQGIDEHQSRKLCYGCKRTLSG